MEFGLIAVEHGHKAQNPQRQHDQHGQPHTPVHSKQQHQHGNGSHDVGGHFRHDMGQGGFNRVHPLYDDILIGAGGLFQHRPQGQGGQLIQQPHPDVRQHMKGSVVGQGGGDGVQHVAQHPPCPHDQTAVQAPGLLRRAVQQGVDQLNHNQVWRQRAGHPRQGSQYAEQVLPSAGGRQLHQPGDRRTLLSGFLVHISSSF